MNIIDAIEAVNTAADQIRKDDPRLADDLDRASKTLAAIAAARDADRTQIGERLSSLLLGVTLQRNGEWTIGGNAARGLLALARELDNGSRKIGGVA